MWPQTERAGSGFGGLTSMSNATRSAGVLLLAVILCGATGCIRSRVHITSDPSGANVRFQDEERGQTPITIPFIWYWYYDIDVEKDGYEPIHALERFRARPWFIIPLDFFAEIVPVPIPDTRHRHYVLTPVPEPGI